MEEKQVLQYQRGFGNQFMSEALPDSLPKINTPQRCPRDLYAEQISGTSFTYPRHRNQRTWMYRIRPSVCHKPYSPIDMSLYPDFVTSYQDDKQVEPNPNQLRWLPLPLELEKKTKFWEGLHSICGNGDPEIKSGLGIYMYRFNQSMKNEAFFSADGDIMIVPQIGALRITTELGILEVAPNEIAVIQRGIKYAVALVKEGEVARGYACEIYKGHFELPGAGPIGANCLANPKDFKFPVARFEDKDYDGFEFTIVEKMMGRFFQAKMNHSIFDVVAWYGNYAPYKYCLDDYIVIGSISREHPDPSIFTVLTCQSDDPGEAQCDFVIFPARWLVAEGTFRPPYYHRNTMSEFMGNIKGTYDAREKGFIPGAASLHVCMTPHGPETEVFEKASTADLKPMLIGDGSMAFMFESNLMLKTSKRAIQPEKMDVDYQECWAGLKKKFKSE